MKHEIRILSNTLLTAGILFPINMIAGQQPKPNVVILIADDISMSDFGCYGHPTIKTPNIDALASDGIRFTNTFLMASSSSPSRASIITGRYPHNTGACELHSPMGEEQVFLPKVLKDAGYYTAQAGKWHFGSAKLGGPGTSAFDRTGGSENDGGGKSGAEKFVPYLKERPTDKPFFMWFAAHDAHREWDDEIFLKKYEQNNVIVEPYFVNDSLTREDFASYYNEVSRFDFYVGKVVNELKAQGVYNSTLIIVMADNGRPFAHSKTRLIESGIKTPFIIHYPKLINKTGQVCKSLLSVIDIAPTIAEITGVKSSPTFQGKSFANLLKNPNTSFRNYVFAEHNWHDFEAYERMVSTEKYLLIENKRPNLDAQGSQDVMTGGSGVSLRKGYKDDKLNSLQKDIFVTPRSSIELYDRNNDPENVTNIAATQPEKVKELQAILHKWKEETGDTEPTNLTPDWYSRQTMDKLPTSKKRGEMPGKSKSATLINNPGQF